MRIVKRLFDLSCSSVGLLCLLPVFSVASALIKIDSPGPVFFRQERAGKDGRMFRIYKFRTMVENAENMGAGYFVEGDDSRITRVGRILRNTSIDELPQLINILKGEMSLVGPRPALLHQVKEYDQRQRQRLLLMPGVTGWAQVNGRNNRSWPERIELDLWYLHHNSLWLDLLILFKTAIAVLKREGIYRETEDYRT